MQECCKHRFWKPAAKISKLYCNQIYDILYMYYTIFNCKSNKYVQDVMKEGIIVEIIKQVMYTTFPGRMKADDFDFKWWACQAITSFVYKADTRNRM